MHMKEVLNKPGLNYKRAHFRKKLQNAPVLTYISREISTFISPMIFIISIKPHKGFHIRQEISMVLKSF